MNDIDKLFRESYRTPRPSTPPTGRWEDMMAAGPTVPAAPAGGVGSYLLMALFAVAVASVWIFRPYQSGGINPQMSDEQVNAQVRRDYNPAPSETRSPRLSAVMSGNPPITSPDRTPQLPPPSTKESMKAPRPVRKVRTAAKPLPRQNIYHTTDGLPDDRDQMLRKTRTVVSVPLASLPILVSNSADSQLLNRLPRPKLNVSDEWIGPVRGAAGRWEGSLRLGARFGFRRIPVTTYSLTEPSSSNASGPFLVDGLLIHGRTEANFLDFSRRTFHWGSVAVGLSRQLANGLRLGTELLFEQQRQSLYLSPSELISDQFPQGSDFAIYEESRREDYSLVFNAGYTFRQYRRLQFYAGATLISRFSRSGFYADQLLRYADGQVYRVGSRPIFVRELGHDLRVLPQLGVRYALTEVLGFGVITGPGLNAMLGYSF